MDRAHSELIYILGYQLRRAELNTEFQALSEITDLTYDQAFHWCLLRNALWEPDTAVDELAKFIQTDPEDRWSRLAIAENYRRMGRLDEAETTLAPLPAIDRDAMAIRVMLALDRHQDDQAEEMLKSSPPDDPDLARLRGRLALARHDMATAVRSFRTALDGLPEDRDALFGLSNALTMQGDEKSAAPLRDKVKQLELLNSLVQRAANPAERGKPESHAPARCSLRGAGPLRRGPRLVQAGHRQRSARHDLAAGTVPDRCPDEVANGADRAPSGLTERNRSGAHHQEAPRREFPYPAGRNRREGRLAFRHRRSHADRLVHGVCVPGGHDRLRTRLGRRSASCPDHASRPARSSGWCSRSCCYSLESTSSLTSRPCSTTWADGWPRPMDGTACAGITRSSSLPW